MRPFLRGPLPGFPLRTCSLHPLCILSPGSHQAEGFLDQHRVSGQAAVITFAKPPAPARFLSPQGAVPARASSRTPADTSCRGPCPCPPRSAALSPTRPSFQRCFLEHLATFSAFVMEKSLHLVDGFPCPWNCFISQNLVAKGTDMGAEGGQLGLGDREGSLEGGQWGIHAAARSPGKDVRLCDRSQAPLRGGRSFLWGHGAQGFSGPCGRPASPSVGVGRAGVKTAWMALQGDR